MPGSSDDAVISFNQELPRTSVPDIPTWSENYCWTGYDYERKVGYWLHLGRWVENPHIWREEVIVFLPDGTVLLWRSFGRSAIPNGAEGALLRFVCEEPGMRWRLQYEGPAQQATLAQMMRAPLPQARTLDYLDLDLEFAGNAPVWQFPDHDNTTIGRWHYEQHGKVTGRIRHGETEHLFDGHGYRDHTRGARELSQVNGHCWIQGRFPDGEAFSIYHLWHVEDGRDKEVLSVARIDRGGKTLEASIVSSPRLQSHQTALDIGELVLELADRTRMVIECIPLTTLVMTMHGRNSHLMFGAMIGDTGWPVPLFEQPAVFKCAGRRAEGWIERCYRRNDAVFDQAEVDRIYASRLAL
jgi:hypothetical protein